MADLPRQGDKMIKHPVLIAVFIALLGSVAGHAQHAGHSGHAAAPASSAPASSAATKAYQAVNAKMHKDMDIRFSGNADADFARAMIPHHQGAVDMARVVLQHGKDPALKKLAEDIIASQDKEISFMRDWLKKNGQ
jgi:uncharacterized protein (DUF305 family)